MKLRTRRVLIFFSLFGLFTYMSPAQQSSEGNNNRVLTQIDRGIELYSNGRWGEAIVQLRRAQQENIGARARAEAQFWIAMSEFAAGQYRDAIHDFDEISRIDPGNIRCVEVPYQKGRANYYLKRYDEAITLLSAYADSIRVDGRYLNGIRVSGWNESGFYNDPDGDYNRKAAAIYWMGECFYAMDDMKRSEELFNIVVKEYSKSHKFEASTNRLALIKQKKIEVELLNILKSIPSETQQNARANPPKEGYETAPPASAPAQSEQEQQAMWNEILEYQKRIAPYLITEAYNGRVNEYTKGDDKGGTAPSPVTTTAVPRVDTPPVVEKPPAKNTDTIIRLLSIKTTALEILERLVTMLNTYDLIEDERW
ncbi:MAG: tetratricopeptide repeat protein [Spirochaetaceae bacterium]|nr:tetratricopeptide repeat protein [Spirochaetaceae bacterium]